VKKSHENSDIFLCPPAENKNIISIKDVGGSGKISGTGHRDEVVVFNQRSDASAKHFLSQTKKQRG